MRGGSVLWEVVVGLLLLLLALSGLSQEEEDKEGRQHQAKDCWAGGLDAYMEWGECLEGWMLISTNLH